MRSQVNKIRNKIEVTTVITERQRCIRKYCKQLPVYNNKLDNFKEMGKCLEICNLPRLTQEENENLNTPVTTNKIKSKNSQQTKVLD